MPPGCSLRWMIVQWKNRHDDPQAKYDQHPASLSYVRCWMREEKEAAAYRTSSGHLEPCSGAIAHHFHRAESFAAADFHPGRHSVFDGQSAKSTSQEHSAQDEAEGQTFSDSQKCASTEHHHYRTGHASTADHRGERWRSRECRGGDYRGLG